MEICAEIRATREEMLEYFRFDEVLDIRYFERTGDKNLYKAVIRIPECGIGKISRPVTLDRLKQKVVKECAGTLPIHSKIIFADKSSRIIYAGTPYWEKEYAKIYARHFKTKVMRIERIQGG